MISLKEYVIIQEGAMAGHMKKPEDFPELTLKELKDLVLSVFGYSDPVEFTEKLDGTNIQATMNNQGEVVFIRNKGDLNSENGGMSISDMQEKWKDNPRVANVFVQAGKILDRVMKKVGKEFFNPNEFTRIYVNCECITAGKTNIMVYDKDSVDIHNLWIYKKEGNEWKKDSVTRSGLDKIQKVFDKDDKAQITPKVIMKTNELSKKYANEICNGLDNLWKQEGLKEDDTLETWEHARFKKIAPEWMTDEDGAFFNRWFKMDKSINMRILKKNYPEHASELTEIDKKDSKKYVSDVMDPIDQLFVKCGNYAISLIDGLQNVDPKNKKVTDVLKNDLENVKKEVENVDDMDTKAKFAMMLQRLGNLDDINATEGIVFTWKGRMMKLTGSFAALNQCLGLLRFKR